MGSCSEFAFEIAVVDALLTSFAIHQILKELLTPSKSIRSTVEFRFSRVLPILLMQFLAQCHPIDLAWKVIGGTFQIIPSGRLMSKTRDSLWSFAFVFLPRGLDIIHR